MHILVPKRSSNEKFTKKIYQQMRLQQFSISTKDDDDDDEKILCNEIHFVIGVLCKYDSYSLRLLIYVNVPRKYTARESLHDRIIFYIYLCMCDICVQCTCQQTYSHEMKSIFPVKFSVFHSFFKGELSSYSSFVRMSSDDDILLKIKKQLMCTLHDRRST